MIRKLSWNMELCIQILFTVKGLHLLLPRKKSRSINTTVGCKCPTRYLDNFSISWQEISRETTEHFKGFFKCWVKFKCTSGQRSYDTLFKVYSKQIIYLSLKNWYLKCFLRRKYVTDFSLKANRAHICFKSMSRILRAIGPSWLVLTWR